MYTNVWVWIIGLLSSPGFLIPSGIVVGIILIFVFIKSEFLKFSDSVYSMEE